MLNATNWFAFGSWLPPREARESGRPLGKRMRFFANSMSWPFRRPESEHGAGGGRSKGISKTVDEMIRHQFSTFSDGPFEPPRYYIVILDECVFLGKAD